MTHDCVAQWGVLMAREGLTTLPVRRSPDSDILALQVPLPPFLICP